MLHRDLTFGVFGKWLHVVDDQERYPPLFGFDQLFGGPTVKFLLLLSLQARCINISNEVLTLLRDGHVEAAAARTRSLWEVVVTSVVLVSSREENGWEITDRYYLSTLHEMQKDGFDDDHSPDLADFPGLTEKIRDAWGKEFFDQYGWARPLIPNLPPKARVTFRHLEEVAGGEDFRFLYREFNHAVHSGATNTVTRLDTRRPDINPTRPTADFETTARVGWACTRFSTICLTETALSISTGTSEWDSMLSCWEVLELSEEITEAFDECIGGHSHD
ncbi:DUF5677 domain-containing protein [Micromonospora tulbaghiae]|uniref:DUF5677 domain-containing protein n=1 Tax=Micromonospora tulbaghiae TaxID=479978 RepID=UPI0033EF786D